MEEQLKETPAQISIMDLLMSFDSHKDAMLKVLSGVSVPSNTTSEALVATIGKIIEANMITFRRDELPIEGASHNKSLHITVKYRKKLVSRVLVDGGSGVNNCPLFTLRDLGIHLREVKESHVRVTTFDGSQKDVIGGIYLALKIRNALDTHRRGCPIHLTPMHEFEWGCQEIMVHGEWGHSAYLEHAVLFIEGLDRVAFHVVEIMQTSKMEETEQNLGMQSLYRSKMAMREMMKYGYRSGTGQRANSDGITEPIEPKEQKGRAGININLLSPVKQKPRKFKLDLSLRIKEEVTKQIEANVARVTNYPKWLENIVPVPKKDEKIRICMEYRDLNKASPKDDFPLPNIHILIDNYTKHELQSFVALYVSIDYAPDISSQPTEVHLKKPMPTAKLTKWQILLMEFDIMYITQKAIKGQALADNLAENLVDGNDDPLTTYFPNEKVLFPREVITESYPRWRMFFNGASNFKGVRIGNEFADALATLSPMIQHPDKDYIDHIEVEIMDQHAYCFHVVEEPDGKPWYHDIEKILTTRDYQENATNGQRRALRKLANHIFLNGEVLYRRTPYLGLLRYVDAAESTRLLEGINTGTCGPHMNGFTLAKNILRDGCFWMAMESDSIHYIQKCHQCQIHGDFIRVPLNELNVMGLPCPFAAWIMDVIGHIEPTASNRHRFILVAIDYFTKLVEASTYKAVTKKVPQSQAADTGKPYT
ncbi:uncharacterized protein [Nicotiana tomentosiformis]|uniref:uncharacterized protein n=1 Tax=Nicotiana tomentosiformis TaxID=4098 RepID=UPI00388CE2C7